MRFLFILVLSIFPSLIVAKNIEFFKGTWLCKADSTIGYNWDKEELKWIPVNYNPNEYVFKTEETDCWNKVIDLEYSENMFCGGINELKGWLPFVPFPFYFVEKSSANEDTFISGQTTMYDRFRMSEKGKFMLVFNIYDRGHLDLKPIDKDSMSISVGSCTKID